MAHPFHHAESSGRKHGGQMEDYLPIHQWFDESKRSFADNRHRALRHHAEGIYLCEQIFGVTITNSAGCKIPVRFIGEQHVQEDLGWIPTSADWLKEIRPKSWMGTRSKLQAPPGKENAKEPNRVFSESSTRKYGGKPEDYLLIHQWFDESKRSFADNRHRALRHHAEGIYLCEQIFGVTITNSAGRKIPVRFIGEQHVQEDLGWIPSSADWLKEIRLKSWMGTRSKLQAPPEKENAKDPNRVF